MSRVQYPVPAYLLLRNPKPLIPFTSSSDDFVSLFRSYHRRCYPGMVSIVVSLHKDFLVLNSQSFDFEFVPSTQVVRLCAKSREAVSSLGEHLTLHYQNLKGIYY
ncbi:hypothetical protein L1987_60339 [Smallanthus sonchifolius]|uniref:Uncharacterized protein n=1 Tax=Smallanthus sonchifolius TaxID=185202 RepID=A0ACB9D8M6_9ASTR|nr:hypothetical protein L1987_60339 [Smallanthus sonchifolius]